MKRIAIAIVILVAFASTLSAQEGAAQEEAGKISVYVNSGVSLPMNPEIFSDYWKMGFNFGGGVGYSFTPNLSVVGSFGYNSFAFDEDGFLDAFGMGETGISVDGASASIITGSASIKASFLPAGSAVSPYGIAGAGLFKLTLSETTVSYMGISETVPEVSETKAGAHFGAGLDYMLNEKIGLFIEGIYGIGLTEGESTGYVPIRVGASIQVGN